MPKSVIIRVIPHYLQRYETVGDWEVTGDRGEQHLVVSVSETGDWRANMLIGVHELVEALLCIRDHVTQEEVDAFDKAFERDRQPGDESEPGDHYAAPYARQHCFATAVERMLCPLLGLSWSAYEKRVLELPTEKSPP